MCGVAMPRSDAVIFAFHILAASFPTKTLLWAKARMVRAKDAVACSTVAIYLYDAPGIWRKWDIYYLIFSLVISRLSFCTWCKHPAQAWKIAYLDRDILIPYICPDSSQLEKKGRWEKKLVFCRAISIAPEPFDSFWCLLSSWLFNFARGTQQGC